MNYSSTHYKIKKAVIDGIDYELVIKDTADNKQEGWFEYYDLETGGEDEYAEGGIWVENSKVRDYDGVFELPEVILEWLNQFNINTEDL